MQVEIKENLQNIDKEPFSYFNSLDSTQLKQLQSALEETVKDADKVSQYYLGLLYLYKLQCKLDSLELEQAIRYNGKELIQKGMNWLLKSAEAGYAPAQYEYGYWLFRGGYGYEHILDEYGELSFDFIEAYYESEEWFLKAAKQNYGKAYMELGEHHTNSFASDYDQDKDAEYWYEKAAEYGNKEACIILGDIYSGYQSFVSSRRMPHTISKDLKKAKDYYAKAQHEEGMKRIAKEIKYRR